MSKRKKRDSKPYIVLAVIALLVVGAVVMTNADKVEAQSEQKGGIWISTDALLELVGSFAGLFGSEPAAPSVGGTRFPSGLSADSTAPSNGEVRGTTLTITGTSTASGLLKSDAGHRRSYTNSTSTTATSYTLLESDIQRYDTVLMTPNTGALTLTLPATSTWDTYIPDTGDMAEQCWYNATSTAAATITFAAGTGIDLETASSTFDGSIDLTIESQGYGCFKFIREADTDIGALFTEYDNGD